MGLLFGAAFFKGSDKNTEEGETCSAALCYTECCSSISQPEQGNWGVSYHTSTSPSYILWLVKSGIDGCARVVAGPLCFSLQGPQQDPDRGRPGQGVQLVRERSARPVRGRPLGEGRGRRQLLGLHRALLAHREAAPLQELWTALLPEVSSQQPPLGSIPYRGLGGVKLWNTAELWWKVDTAWIMCKTVRLLI